MSFVHLEGVGGTCRECSSAGSAGPDTRLADFISPASQSLAPRAPHPHAHHSLMTTLNPTVTVQPSKAQILSRLCRLLATASEIVHTPCHRPVMPHRRAPQQPHLIVFSLSKHRQNSFFQRLCQLSSRASCGLHCYSLTTGLSPSLHEFLGRHVVT